MPNQLERVGFVTRGDQRQLGIALERAGKVANLAIDPRGERRLRKAGPDRRGDVGRRGAGLDFAHGAVGKGDLEVLGHDRAACNARAHTINPTGHPGTRRGNEHSASATG